MPRARPTKECACGCAGVFTAHAAIELYAEVFAANHALERLEAFASVHGAAVYGLARNPESITLTRAPWRVPEAVRFGDEALVPFRAGAEVQWRVESVAGARLA